MVHHQRHLIDIFSSSHSVRAGSNFTKPTASCKFYLKHHVTWMMSISREWISWLQTYVRAPHLVSRYTNRLYLRSLQSRRVSCSRSGQQAPWNLAHEHSSTVVHSGTIWSQIPPQCDHLASKRKLVSSEFWIHKTLLFCVYAKTNWKWI